jgi:hypothetical protein
MTILEMDCKHVGRLQHELSDTFDDSTSGGNALGSFVISTTDTKITLSASRRIVPNEFRRLTEGIGNN